jgi:hypothetical protein
MVISSLIGLLQAGFPLHSTNLWRPLLPGICRDVFELLLGLGHRHGMPERSVCVCVWRGGGEGHRIKEDSSQVSM